MIRLKALMLVLVGAELVGAAALQDTVFVDGRVDNTSSVVLILSALIAIIVPLTTTVLGYLQVKGQRKLDAVKEKIEEVAVSTDGRLDRLLERTAALEEELRRVNADPEKGSTPVTRDEGTAPGVTMSRDGTITTKVKPKGHPDESSSPAGGA